MDGSDEPEERQWWKEATVYQIYPRSFDDSDGDGIGDLPGVLERLDYLDDLGVDVVWLNPVYDSPMVDYGYDVRDFRAIHSEFGTMADWEAIRDGLHERGIRLIMDIAINHTSNQHRWFERSRRGETPYDDYYHWVDGEPGEPPNNWGSFFGGPAWSYDEVREAWYLSLFDDTQPDLNWANPAVREEMYDVLGWWLDRGSDGFRLDVVNLLSKAEGYPDGDPDNRRLTGAEHFFCGPRIHEYVREMHERVLDDNDAFTVGETVNVTPEQARRFTVEDGLDVVFPFEHVNLGKGDAGPWDTVAWDLPEFKRVTERWQTEVGEGWIGVYLGNHDQPRMVSRFGDDGEYRVESAKLLATYLNTLRGTTFCYQGDEIGMTNAPFERLEQFRDPATREKVRVAVGSSAGSSGGTGDGAAFEEIAETVAFWSRDNARTPMQWSDAEHAGFTTGEPWIMVNPNHEEVNVERARAEPDSVFHYYRRLIRLRHDVDALVYGEFDLLAPDHPEVFAYLRSHGDERLLVVLNVSSREPTFAPPQGVDLEGAERLVGNYDQQERPRPEALDLRPFEAIVYRLG